MRRRKRRERRIGRLTTRSPRCSWRRRMRCAEGIGWRSFLGGRFRLLWRLLGRGRIFCRFGDSGRLDLCRLMVDGESGRLRGVRCVWKGERLEVIFGFSSEQGENRRPKRRRAREERRRYAFEALAATLSERSPGTDFEPILKRSSALEARQLHICLPPAQWLQDLMCACGASARCCLRSTGP